MNMLERTTATRQWNHQTARYDYSFAFEFQEKEQYLEFRKLWRDAYRLLSAEIRNWKGALRAAHRALSVATSEAQATVREQRLLCLAQVRDSLCRCQEEARKQMAMRTASKMECQRQYLERKAKQ